MAKKKTSSEDGNGAPSASATTDDSSTSTSSSTSTPSSSSTSSSSSSNTSSDTPSDASSKDEEKCKPGEMTLRFLKKKHVHTCDDDKCDDPQHNHSPDLETQEYIYKCTKKHTRAVTSGTLFQYSRLGIARTLHIMFCCISKLTYNQTRLLL
eukprot:TRINITY_DN4812_c0_g1_i2.p1 TRINITY_DN4812_c0_g1~~TRINITY_DN4812_c0_g1_i2.p1  ORF type:complete len:152 (+),score=42.93 TRINITY_DN4812_c0_g1_i2:139-594(+)